MKTGLVTQISTTRAGMLIWDTYIASGGLNLPVNNAGPTCKVGDGQAWASIKLEIQSGSQVGGWSPIVSAMTFAF